MNKILVTTDFSANSKGGIRFAIQMAKQTGCVLIFHHIIEVMKPTSWNEAHYKKFAKQLIEENTRKLEKFVAELFSEAGVRKSRSHVYVAEIGTAVDELIIKQAKKVKADYICMSTRGAGRIKKLFGTNASSLITESPIPVIVIPQGYKAKPVSKILYASDFSAIARELKTVKEFAAPFKAEIEVFHYDYLLNVEEVRKKLEKKVKALNVPDIKFYFRKQEIEDSISTQLSEDIPNRKPSVVVLFTKQNRNWFDRLFARSESREMSFHNKIPLLVFKKKG